MRAHHNKKNIKHIDFDHGHYTEPIDIINIGVMGEGGKNFSQQKWNNIYWQQGHNYIL